MEQSVLNKSFHFAVRIVKLCNYLQEEKKAYVLSKQLLRCGTSIGANVREASQAVSRADFINKLSIALKESVETEYWLELLHETDYLNDAEFHSIYTENKELTKMLTSIINTSKRNDSGSSN